jgi:hypothetical protein
MMGQLIGIDLKNVWATIQFLTTLE